MEIYFREVIVLTESFDFKEAGVAFSTRRGLEKVLTVAVLSLPTCPHKFIYMHVTRQTVFFYESKGDDAVMRWSGCRPTVGVAEICHLKLIWHTPTSAQRENIANRSVLICHETNNVQWNTCH